MNSLKVQEIFGWKMYNSTNKIRETAKKISRFHQNGINRCVQPVFAAGLQPPG